MPFTQGPRARVNRDSVSEFEPNSPSEWELTADSTMGLFGAKQKGLKITDAD